MIAASAWAPLVVDLGVGMAAALIAKLLAEQGARVVRIEPGASDPFHDVYPAYRLWHSGATRTGREHLDTLLASADICLVGGEDYPGFEWSFDAAALARNHERLVVLELSASTGKDVKAVDLLVQARTGLSFEQFSDRPICFATALPSYGAALLAMIGVWAALLERTRSGRGQLVRASMQQGVALFWSPFWMKAAEPDAAFNTITPKDVRHLIFRCADGGYIQFAMGVPGAVSKLYAVLNIDAPADPADRGHPRPDTDLARYFGDRDLISPRILQRQGPELLAALRRAGIAAEAVLQPGECWEDEQVLYNAVIREHGGWRYVGAPIAAHGIAGAPRHSVVPAAAHAPPLSGLRIIDFGNFVAGPFASRLLASLGADVIKVDPPSGAATISGYRTVYASNCGKRSLCADLKTPQGREIALCLCGTADAVHHNFRLGVAERLGVDAASLRKSNPRLVVFQTTAYGTVGPKAAHPGFDMVMQALCGHEARAGGEGNPPLWYRSPFVDFATGGLGAVAMLAALVRREVSGEIVDAQVSLLNTALFLMSELVQNGAGEFVGAGTLDRELTGFHPAESLYQTQDGWIAVAARSDAMAQRFARVLQLQFPVRCQWRATEARALRARIRERYTEELLAEMKAADVWAERCVEDGWAALQSDAFAREAGLLVEVDDQRYGRVAGCLGSLVNFSRSSNAPNTLRGAPVLGQHSTELLQELGYSDEDIRRLRESRAIV